ncbi:hypothetical protein AOC36_09190 [Erysipelothrix larvae]|uniref:[Citrate [pro-3S]-lyase] ligase n=1 Tax=Erysipelothrix larvae TaxID=1514105 RepID=A0A109UHG4_9FIRM|nr:[citrate (pro-3S)-lyase] ligase [Erysipelothrix larvae]AMC94156.1 hypothetical protein AOC36_09190 [Erysipelothrix larvae]
MFQLKQLFIHRNQYQKDTWESFLKTSGIKSEASVDAVYGIYDDQTLIGTGAIYQNILKCLAISEDYQGGAALNKLISHLMDAVWQKGYTACYVYTKPSVVQSFMHLGFKEIVRVNDALVFLEKSMTGLDSYLAYLKDNKQASDNACAIVMNANPFTLGHQYLVEQASSENDCVYVFVVNEDSSQFPSAIRKELVVKGVSHLKNVVVLDTRNYMVSSQTFPSYFLKDDQDVTRVHATLDAMVFKTHIAPALSITKRFVGDEPYSFATAIYNTVLKEVLEPTIHVEILERKKINNHIVSATTVRKLLKEKNTEAVKPFVPATTYQYLISTDGQKTIEKLRTGGSGNG